ncbi:MAG: O-antigen ligase family protein [Cytophagaceae bacterium]
MIASILSDHKLKIFAAYSLITISSVSAYLYYGVNAFLLIPPSLIIFFLAVFDYKKITYLTFFLIPLSVDLALSENSLVVGTPSEPLIGLLALVAVALLFTKKFDGKFLRNPMTIFIVIHLATCLVALFFSTSPIISLKFLTVKTAYILVFYFLAAQLLSHDIDKVKRLILLYILGIIPVIIFIIHTHSQSGFDKNVSNLVTGPFFNDHTIYGACLCLAIPMLTGFILCRKTFNISFFTSLVLCIVLTILLIALFLTFSRAAWVSLLVSFGVVFIIKIRIPFKLILSVSIIIAASFLFAQDKMVSLLKQNKYDSNAKNAGIDEQMKSVTSIKKDVSNAERVNRWNSAIKMFKEKPLTGFGPGTYQFTYIPFQMNRDMTEISITSAKHHVKPGKGGSAHSEYLLLLSESGIFPFITFIIIAFMALYYTMKIYNNSQNRKIKILALCAGSSLMGYFVHGLFNNFLDQEEAASIFWLLLSSIVVLYLLHKKEQVNSSTLSL